MIYVQLIQLYVKINYKVSLYEETNKYTHELYTFLIDHTYMF